jgi:predicted Fe-Mo cluster-binding NifX family protein
MKIVVAVEGGADGYAATHFAHCSHFIVFEEKNGKITNAQTFENPYFKEHVPGAIPKFVKSLDADVLITDGIGRMAINLFADMGIKVIFGNKGKARELAEQYIKQKLESKGKPCDH